MEQGMIAAAERRKPYLEMGLQSNDPDDRESESDFLWL